MATINQTFKSGQEYTFSISQVPEISTDTAVINFVGDASGNLTARKISDTVFGLTYSGSSNTFTSNIQLVINGVSGYDNGLTVNLTVNGTLAKEPVRIYNPSNYTVSVGIYRISSSAPTLDIYYCVGNSEGTYQHYINSTDYGYQTPVKSFNLSPGQSVWIYSDNMTRWAANGSDYIYIKTPDYTNVNEISISGDIMSLITGALQNKCFFRLFVGFKTIGVVSNNFLSATTLASNCYENMFQNCTSLTTAPSLPATTLAQGCYYGMFQNCTSLTTAPSLPATTLAQDCYYYMFQNCTSLTTAPSLPATTLFSSCYYGMFQDCTSLTDAPSLPATTLKPNCYQNMFNSCTSLINIPTLSATTLAYACYKSMFQGCTSLTTVPAINAVTLVSDCYSYMFQGCTHLNYIKALFTTTPSNSYTVNWVNKVSSTGTFVKNHNATWNVTGTNGVPTNWTVITDLDEYSDE